MAQALSGVLNEERVAGLRVLAEMYGVKNLRVFGSYARGEAGPDSDLDLLVEIEYGRGVAKRFLSFCEHAERLLGVKLDVLTQDALDGKLHARILREARPL